MKFIYIEMMTYAADYLLISDDANAPAQIKSTCLLPSRFFADIEVFSMVLMRSHMLPLSSTRFCQ